MSRTVLLRGLVGAGLILCALPGSRQAAHAEEPIPRELVGIEIKERLGAQLPLDVPLTDQHGRSVKLRDYLVPGRPVILTMNYYGCPTLCSLVLNGVMLGLRDLDFDVGKQFQIVTLSINPLEGPDLATAKREAYVATLGHKIDDAGWPFLTGKKDDIKAVADAAGFQYRYDEETRQFAHAAGIFVLTPEGKISRTLYGIEFRSRDLRLALVEASRGAIGSPVDRLLLFCYHYDPQTRKYGLTPMAVMRIGGALTVIFLGTVLLAMWRRERRAQVLS